MPVMEEVSHSLLGGAQGHSMLAALSREALKTEDHLLESVAPSVDSKVFMLIFQQTDGNVKCTIKRFRISWYFNLKASDNAFYF